jgi:hypothetical protein
VLVGKLGSMGIGLLLRLLLRLLLPVSVRSSACWLHCLMTSGRNLTGVLNTRAVTVALPVNSHCGAVRV